MGIAPGRGYINALAVEINAPQATNWKQFAAIASPASQIRKWAKSSANLLLFMEKSTPPAAPVGNRMH
jgi:hypothetical protein